MRGYLIRQEENDIFNIHRWNKNYLSFTTLRANLGDDKINDVFSPIFPRKKGFDISYKLSQFTWYANTCFLGKYVNLF